MESLGINFDFLLVQIFCFGGPMLTLIIAAVLFFRQRKRNG